MSEIAIESSIKKQTISSKEQIDIGINCKLTLNDINILAYKALPIKINPESYSEMHRSYQFLQTHLDQNKIKHSEHINQENISDSNTHGLGNIIPSEIIRAAMMLRIHSFAQGYSGVNPNTVDVMLTYLNAGIIPIVRHYGSIGGSGDLLPLAMIATGVINLETDVLYHGELMSVSQALELTGLEKSNPPNLLEDLAMINGNSFMVATSSLALYKLNRLYKQMLTAIAMSLESMLVISSGYHPLVHQLKRQVGENIVNQFLLDFWKGSRLLSDLEEIRDLNMGTEELNLNTKSIRPVQDFYSLRSVSQGFGPFEENIERAIIWIENEINAVHDSPIINIEANKIDYCPNFMGYHITDTCDILKMDIAQASTWLHALLANMLHPRKNHGLPANLVDDAEKHEDFRSLQVLSASLAVQNRKLALSHQAVMLPTEGDNQDVNSLGTHAALDLRESIANLEHLTAILLLASVQALNIRGIENAGENTKRVHNIICEHLPNLPESCSMTNKINIIIDLLEEEKI